MNQDNNQNIRQYFPVLLNNFLMNCSVLAGFYFGQKRIAFVLSSSKWIDNLLTIKHSQNDENSLFNTFLIFQHVYLDRRYNYPEHRGITQFHLIHVVNQLCFRKRSGPKIYLCGTPQLVSPKSEKTSSSATKIFLFRDMIETI